MDQSDNGNLHGICDHLRQQLPQRTDECFGVLAVTSPAFTQAGWG